MMATGRSTPTSRRESAAFASGPSSAGSAFATSVQVVLRIRPPTNADYATIPQRLQSVVVRELSSTTLQVDAAAAAAAAGSSTSVSKKTGALFSFDRVISPSEGQASVYEAGAPLLEGFLKGINCTVLAYGQTSSGKSYTMGTEGLETAFEDEDRLGFTPRAAKAVFEALDRQAREQGSRFKFEAKVSFVELHNEDLLDLLNPEAEKGSITIREEKGGGILWSGLREVKVHSATEVMRYLASGAAVRQTGSTDMNAQSSRSHAIFSLTVTQRKFTGPGSPPPPTSPNTRAGTPSGLRSPTPTGERPGSRIAMRAGSAQGASKPADDLDGWSVVQSKFHFVDLAGSERLKRTSALGERAKEGISINSGLHALGNVISALGDPAKARQTTHIPYRDSKLTRLLQDSLGGNSLTMMIACVSPTEFNVSETLSTLKYANRARNIKNNATVNEAEAGWDDVGHLQKLVVKLRAQLAEGSPAGMNSMGAIAEESVLDDRMAVLGPTGAAAAAAAVSPAMRNDAFAAAVEPIIEDYEKTLSALESQLSLTRTALAHSEEEMNMFEARASEQARMIEDLKVQAAKRAERESSSEDYIRDLESKLADSEGKEGSRTVVVSSLQAEVAQTREAASKREKYLKDLEAQLSKSEEDKAALDERVRSLEGTLGGHKADLKGAQEKLSFHAAQTEQREQEWVKERKAHQEALAELASTHESTVQEARQELQASHKRALEDVAERHTRRRSEDIKQVQTGHTAALAAVVAELAALKATHQSARDDHSTLAATHDELQSRYVAAEKEREHLAQQAALEKGEKESSSSAYDELNAKHLASLQAHAAELASAKEGHGRELSGVSYELEALKAEHETLRSAHAALTTSHHEATRALDSSRSGSDDLTAKLARLQQEHEAALSSHQSALAGAAGTHEKQIESLEAERDRLAKQVQDFSGQSADVHGNLAAAQSRHETELEALRKSHAGELDKLVQHRDRLLADVEEAKREHDGTRSSLSSAAASHAAALAALAAERDRYKSEHGEMRSAGEKLASEQGLIKDKYTATAMERDALKEQVGKLASDLAELQEKHTTLQATHDRELEAALKTPKLNDSPVLASSTPKTPRLEDSPGFKQLQLERDRLQAQLASLRTMHQDVVKERDALASPKLPLLEPGAMANGRPSAASLLSNSATESSAQQMERGYSDDSVARTSYTTASEAGTDQDSVLGRDDQVTELSTKLAKVEGEAKATALVVKRLETSLANAERELRKARAQMNDATKERDGHLEENADLKKQLEKASEDAAGARRSLSDTEKQLAEEKKGRQRVTLELERQAELAAQKKGKSTRTATLQPRSSRYTTLAVLPVLAALLFALYRFLWPHLNLDWPSLSTTEAELRIPVPSQLSLILSAVGV